MKKNKARRPRPIHKKIALHPVNIFFLLCLGVLLVAVTFHAGATDYQVRASVAGPPPEEPAVITPPPTTQTNTQELLVTGTCPDGSYVKVYNNNIFSGVTACSPGGTFQMLISLVEGTNELSARVFNSTDDEGPTSPLVAITYHKPIVPPPTSPSSPKPSPSSGAPITPVAATSILRLLADYHYEVWKSGEPVMLELGIEGGQSPYAVAIDWGDNQVTPVLRTEPGMFKVSHTYPITSERAMYNINIRVTDASGNTTLIQLMAVVNGETPAAGATSDSDGAGLLTTVKNWLWLAWPAYGIFVLMVLSFWLGEREELRLLLKNQPRISHHRR